MTKKLKFLNIIYLLLILFYITTGIIVLIYANKSYEKNSVLLGVLIVLSSIPSLLSVVTQGKIKEPSSLLSIAFGLIGIAIGIVAAIKTDAQIEKICIVWGTFDLCRAAFDICKTIPKLKNHEYFELVELVLAIGEIAIAVLLVLDGFKGINLHLYYFGITFVVIGTKRFIDYLLRIFKKKNEKSVDSN